MKTIKITRTSPRPVTNRGPGMGESYLPVREGLEIILDLIRDPGWVMVALPHFEYVLRHQTKPNDEQSPVIFTYVGSSDQRIKQVVDRLIEQARKLRFGGPADEQLPAIEDAALRKALLIATGHTDLTESRLAAALAMDEKLFLDIMTMVMEDGKPAAEIFDCVEAEVVEEADTVPAS